MAGIVENNVQFGSRQIFGNTNFHIYNYYGDNDSVRDPQKPHPLGTVTRKDGFWFWEPVEYILSISQERSGALIRDAEAYAAAGSEDAARLLARLYGTENFDCEEHFNKSPDSTGFGGGEATFDYKMYNPLYNSVKGKEWDRRADHLAGKTTLIERDKFLKEFLYSQDKTPEGLYNIGYALYHNMRIGNQDRGFDYLKHAANLGDANAAREIGEIYQNLFDKKTAKSDVDGIQDTSVTHTQHLDAQAVDAKKGAQADLEAAYFWYKIAASTPMKIAEADGKVTNLDGHPNGKARVAYLEKAYPELKLSKQNETALRNPSPSHIQKYPASMWAAEIPITDMTDLMKNPAHGGMMNRMQKAVEAIDGHVHEFEVMMGGVQAKIDDVIARQAVLDGRVEDLKGEEITALRHNDGLSAEQRKSERAIRISQDRWIKETTANMGGTILVGLFYAKGGFVVEALRMIGHGVPNSPGVQAANLLRANKIRAGGYHAVMKNEVAHHQALIDELEARKIDVSKMPNEIAALAQAVQEIEDSGPYKRLMQDEGRSRAIVEGYLRQKILKSGLGNCRYLDDYAKQNGIESVDALLASFEKSDARLHSALSHLCFGHADSNDMQVLLTSANALTDKAANGGRPLEAHEKAFTRFIERIVKDNLGHYMTCASQIDVIADLKLIDFNTMSVDHSKATADLVRGVTGPSDDEHAVRQVDTATKLALSSMFSQQFGVTHIGQYDITRLFTYYMERHGKDQLIGDELMDGMVRDVENPKAVSALAPDKMKKFVSRAKQSAVRGREDLPDVGDFFLRVCGYEYYLPQAVITSGRGNRFKENPESPVAYPVVNQVVQSFIEKMSLTDTATYREKVGEKLDGLIAQTFIDFFQAVGKEHATSFAPDRERLRDAFAHDKYGPEFTSYEDKITADMLPRFAQFLKIFERNLEKELVGAPQEDAALLRQQIESLHAEAKAHLAPPVLGRTTHQARLEARQQDHRGSNMTEGWRFTG